MGLRVYLPGFLLAVMLANGPSALAVEATLVADTHVNSGRPTSNSGTISNLNVGGGYTTLLQFDLSTLPVGTTAAQVSRATVRLYCNQATTGGLISLQPVGGAWGEYSVTYATLPSLGAAVQVVSVTQGGVYIAVDVTALVQSWVTAPASNFGVALTAGTAAVQFDSKENDQTGHAAVLDVALASQGPAGAGGAPGAPGAPGPVGASGVAGLVGAVGPAGIPGVTGAKGDPGVTGAQGLAGAPGTSGGAGLNYQGAYASATNYGVGDVVLFLGSSYASLLASNHGNTPGQSPQDWGLLAAAGPAGGSGTTAALAYQGSYTSATNYALDDIVNSAGSSYLSLLAGNHGNTPGASPQQWGLLAAGGQGAVGAAGPAGVPGLTYQGVYVSATNYADGDVVTFQGSSYVSLIASNHGNTPGLSPQQWGVLAAGIAGSGGGSAPVGVAYQGTYGPATNYGLNDIVLFAGSSYISLLAGNHGNTPGLSPTYWGVLAQGGSGAVGATGPAGPQGLAGSTGVPGLGYTGAYQSARNYGLSDVAGWKGSSYISLLAGNHGNTPDQSPGIWGLVAAAGVGTTGVQGPAGATGPLGLTGPVGLNGAPGVAGLAGPAGATGNPGLVYQGAYSSGANYAPGDVVLWAGASYVSSAAGNHGNTPGFSPAQWGVLTAQGQVGATGMPGPAGAVGGQGSPGSVGPPGELGAQGPQGIGGQAGTQGLTGAAGAVGLSGPAGAQGVAGPVGLAFQGAYQSGGNYGLGDGVMWNGAGYVSLISGNHGNVPDQSPQAWSLFAASGGAGAVGAQGLTGLAGPAGPAGLAGSAGPVGAAGSPGAQGPPVANFTGDYSSSANYGLNDAVSFGGATYVSMVAGNHGNTPTLSPGQWVVLAGQGATGPTGAAGAAGVAGPQGVPGGMGPAGSQGPPVAFAGGWLTGRSYAVGDAVGYAGSSYVAVVANVGRQPDVSPQYWGALAVGAVGPAGATGLSGMQGPTGYPGATGAAGLAGSSGATGLTGAPGTPGVTGAAGPVGSAGPVGATGGIGAPGANGLTGAQGAQGPPVGFVGGWDTNASYAVGDAVGYGGSSYIAVAANQGREPDYSPRYWGLLAQGSTGAAGAVGATGMQGPSGYPGPMGQPGQVGAAGSQGVAGTLGPAGPIGAAGATGSTGMNGAVGAAGSPGSSGPAGAQGPPIAFAGGWVAGRNYSVGDGVSYAGSSYVAVAGSVGRQPDYSPQSWALLAAGAVGPSGATGATGMQGPTGYPGPSGPAGTTGATGPGGPPGPVGPVGGAGPAGARGLTGAAGVMYRGAYQSATNYSMGDTVTWQGSSYFSTVDGNRGNAPDFNTGAWAMLAAPGSAGAAGTPGADGAQGLPGTIGPQGTPGPSGGPGATGPAGSPGASGAAGPAGPTGQAGATGVAGISGFAYRGAYGSGINYGMNDAVTYLGSTYISVAASNQGNSPDSSPGAWNLIAAQGAAGGTGATGTAGAAGTPGTPGLNGAAGTPGAAGAAGANGLAGLAYQGAFAVAVNYALNDSVTYGGSSYISLVAANRGNTPGMSAGQWGLLAQAGATGSAGVTGPAGAAGGQGLQGMAGAPGVAGPAGAVGMNFRGAWDSRNGYAANDAVSFAGSTYLAESSNSGSEPDLYPQAWTVLAQVGQAGPAGPTGPGGAAATIGIGTVTTGAAGSQAMVTNSGSAVAAVLNFTIPQGVAGTGGGGGGGGGTSGIPFASMYHSVTYSGFYSVNDTNGNASELASVYTWVPVGCSATSLSVFSQQGGALFVRLRIGAPPGRPMADTALSCSVAAGGGSCTATGTVAVAAGSFVDIGISGGNSNPAGVWTALACN